MRFFPIIGPGFPIENPNIGRIKSHPLTLLLGSSVDGQFTPLTLSNSRAGLKTHHLAIGI